MVALPALTTNHASGDGMTGVTGVTGSTVFDATVEFDGVLL
jgi:hypothetical protein